MTSRQHFTFDPLIIRWPVNIIRSIAHGMHTQVTPIEDTTIACVETGISKREPLTLHIRATAARRTASSP